jgi:hypothetical protein
VSAPISLANSTTRLLAHHAALIAASGIGDSVRDARGYFSATDANDLLKLGFTRAQAIVPALVIPIHGPSGGVVTHQTRPDHPRTGESGKPTKYETPAGSRLHLDVPPGARADIGNPAVPLVVTEGVRKADAAVTNGLCTLALLGVWNWRGKNEHGGKVALAEWESVALSDRLVYLVFDSDVTVKNEVRKALERLDGLLTLRGAKVTALQLPGGANGDKVGLDDFLAAGHTVTDLMALPRLSDSATDPVATDQDGGPRVFTIAEARLRNRESIEHLPVLGVDGYVVKGWTHLLAGWWRLGKTELMAATVLPWLRSGLRIVWVTEEPDSIWADRADTFDEIYAPVPYDNLILIDATSATPMELLEKVATIESDVVIADTIREVCGIASMKDDDAVRSAVSPWLRRLRDGHRTLIFLTQHRKAAGEHGERVEGSVALPSQFDVVLELSAVEGHDHQRRLTVRRRRAQTAPLTV